jgi:hypothetical protein
LFSEHLEIFLAPAAISFGDKTIGCDPAFGAEPWQGALAALKALELPKKGRATVVLSNHLVRYAVVPWSSALGTPGEEEAYIRHHFAKIHGERVKGWSLRASPAPGSEARLASAIDKALLDELKNLFNGKSAPRLVSVQPQLMAAFNRWRRAIPAGGAWLVLADAERACVALHGGGGWRAVHNGKGEWLALLDRERHRVEGDVPDLVLICGASAPANDTSWKFRELSA